MPASAPYQRLPIAHLTENDLARRWRMSPRTLQSWRWRKIGPAFIRLHGKVLYRLADVADYELANLRRGEE